MPFITALISSLLSGPILRIFLTRVAIFLGIGALTYGGLATVTSSLLSHAASYSGSLSGFALTFVQMTGVVNAANLVIGAIVGRAALTVLTGGGVLKQLAFSGSTGLSIFG